MSIRTHKIVLRWSKPVPFKTENANTISDEGGVYEILKRHKKEEKNILLRQYVGRADNIQERFNQHLGESEPDDCIKGLGKDVNSRFDYALVSTEDDRKDAEQALYDKWKSQKELQCNNVRPSGSGRNLNIQIEEINP